MELFSLYSWGANSHGQLGLGYQNEQVSSPQKIIDLPFDLSKIKFIEGGGGHTLIATYESLYGSGWNNRGQLALGHFEDLSVFKKIDDRKIDQISCGFDTSAFLESGKLFVFGSNRFNHLGFGEKKDICNIQEHGFNNLFVEEVKLGVRQIVFRSKKSIFISGKSQAVENVKKVGENLKECPEFWELKIGEKITHISSGQKHFLYSQNDEIVGIGDNKFGQSEIQKIPKIIELKSGWSFSGCLNDKGEVYLWGRNNYGQLGQSKISDYELKPQKLEVGNPIKSLHLGSESGLVVDILGQIYTWGWNEHGNCGNGTDINVLKPEKLEVPGKCVLACCGAGFCYALMRN